MLLRWLLFAVAAGSFALGLLTVIKAPDWVNWTVAVLAGEFGYWVALAPLVAAAAVWGLYYPGRLRLAALGLCFAGAALLLQPCVQAWAIGLKLPGQLRDAFGPVELPGSAFSYAGLWSPGPPPVTPSTMQVPAGCTFDFYKAGRARPPAPSGVEGPGAPGKLTGIAEASPAPCVIIIHGGGWNSGERGEVPSLNWRLARDGYAVADISYRLAPAAVWPAQRDDVLGALAYLKARASDLGIDPHRFVLLGRSAGGQIAEATAYAAHDPAIRGVVGLYAPADMHFAYQWSREDDILKSPSLLRGFLGGTPTTAKAAYDSASGILHVTATSPPTLLVHGRLDTLVWHRQSERLDTKLQSAGVPHLFLSLPWATHAVEYHEQGPSGQLTLYALEWFLTAVTL